MSIHPEIQVEIIIANLKESGRLSAFLEDDGLLALNSLLSREVEQRMDRYARERIRLTGEGTSPDVAIEFARQFLEPDGGNCTNPLSKKQERRLAIWKGEYSDWLDEKIERDTLAWQRLEQQDP